MNKQLIMTLVLAACTPQDLVQNNPVENKEEEKVETIVETKKPLCIPRDLYKVNHTEPYMKEGGFYWGKFISNKKLEPYCDLIPKTKYGHEKTMYCGLKDGLSSNQDYFYLMDMLRKSLEEQGLTVGAGLDQGIDVGFSYNPNNPNFRVVYLFFHGEFPTGYCEEQI